MVWESKNKGHFWTEDEKRFHLYARQKIRALQAQRKRRLQRRVLWVTLSVIGIILAATVARSAAPYREKKTALLPQVTHTQVVTVAPGDSLWSIARRYSRQDISTMDSIAVISTLNGNISGKLEPGQRLVIPVF